jgi:hypothetical protein
VSLGCHTTHRELFKKQFDNSTQHGRPRPACGPDSAQRHSGLAVARARAACVGVHHRPGAALPAQRQPHRAAGARGSGGREGGKGILSQGGPAKRGGRAKAKAEALHAHEGAGRGEVRRCRRRAARASWRLGSDLGCKQKHPVHGAPSHRRSHTRNNAHSHIYTQAQAHSHLLIPTPAHLVSPDHALSRAPLSGGAGRATLQLQLTLPCAGTSCAPQLASCRKCTPLARLSSTSSPQQGRTKTYD